MLICKERENWLSPVIQATWEPRTVEWLEKEELLPPGRSNYVAALKGQCHEKSFQTETVGV